MVAADVQAAYERVWKMGTLAKLADAGVSPRLLRFLRNWLAGTWPFRTVTLNGQRTVLRLDVGA